MIKMVKLIILMAMFIAGTMSLCNCFKKKGKTEDFAAIHNYADIVALFPDSASDIEARTTKALDQARSSLDAILAIDPATRSYNNSVHALDLAMSYSDLAIMGNTFSALEMVSPIEAVRTAAHDAVKKINDFGWTQ